MRRIAISSARSTVNAVRHATYAKNPQPFVCACCRIAASQSTSTSTESTQAFSSATEHKQQASPTQTQQPQRESIIPQTHFDFFPKTFPNGPPPNAPFSPDLQALRREFLQIQAKTHPDLAPASQKRQAEALSSRVNEAYKAIQDPLKRAQYLLSLQGIDVEDESAKLAENELLMEVMEAREAVDEVENEEELVSIREENNGRISKSVEVLEKAFAEGAWEQAAQEAIRLRYWMNIEESIHGWEKGQGGGMIHH
jgi:molecular chaperone HscB